MIKDNLEMVTCPKCGKPFPKKRFDLGYRCCVNCSTESQKVCRIEEHGEGDHTYDTISIMTREEALALTNAERNSKGLEILPDEGAAPDCRTFEEQDEQVGYSEAVNILRNEERLDAMEKEFAEMSEKTLREAEAIAPLMEEEEQSEKESEEDDDFVM